MMNNSPIVPECRMPAEWEHNDKIMLAWPHEDTDWNDMLAEVRQTYIEIIRAVLPHASVLLVGPDLNSAMVLLTEAGLTSDRIVFHEMPTNDTWTRDYGPITTVSADGKYAINDFQFNGWGLKFAADKDNLVNKNLYSSGFLTGKYINHLSFTLEGGGMESDGNYTALTTSRCQLSPNRNGGMSAKEIERYICKSLGLKQLLWVDFGFLAGDDTDSHIDTLARFAPGNKILYVGCDDKDDIHFDELKKMERQLKTFRNIDGMPFETIRLPFPSPIYHNGERLPATYANFLIINDAVIVPTYNQPDNDRIALEIISSSFPGYAVKGVDCNSLIKQHGSLHCATMQLP